MAKQTIGGHSMSWPATTQVRGGKSKNSLEKIVELPVEQVTSNRLVESANAICSGIKRIALGRGILKRQNHQTSLLFCSITCTISCILYHSQANNIREALSPSLDQTSSIRIALTSRQPQSQHTQEKLICETPGAYNDSWFTCRRILG